MYRPSALWRFNLTQTFPLCGATRYILPSMVMTQLFNGVNFVYRSVEVYGTFSSYLRVLVKIRKLLQWRTVLTTLAICRIMFNDGTNVDLVRIITRGTNSKFQLTIGVFSIAFAMSVVEKVVEFPNTLTMQYELRCKWWINAVVMILSVPHFLCWLFYFQNIITFYSKN